jgi:hypothetical protein
LGVPASGERVPLPPLISSGNEEVLQSMLIIHQGLRGGDPAGFCREIASRVAEDSSLLGIDAVEIVTSTFDCVGYFEGDTSPRARRVHQRCEVAR